MINTDKYEGTDHPELVEFEGETLGDTLTNLLTEVKRLREELDRAEKECGALWEITDNWGMCEDDYTMHDLYENLDERYAWDDDVDGNRIILKELYTYTEEDGWLRNEELEGEEE